MSALLLSAAVSSKPPPFDVVQIQERRAHRMGRCLYGAVSIWCGGGMAEGERRGMVGGAMVLVMVAENFASGHNWPQRATILATMATMATIGHNWPQKRAYVCVYVGTNTWFFGGKGGIYFRAPFSQKIFLFLVSSCILLQAQTSVASTHSPRHSC